MTERMVLQLWEPVQAWKAIDAAWRHVKALLLAGHRLQLEIKPAKRTLSQNAKFHAICGDVAASGIEWAGKKRNKAEWKVLLVSGHAAATKEGSEMVPGLEGEFVNLRESTARMSKARGASLIEYTLAFCADRGVKLKAQIDPETGEVL